MPKPFLSLRGQIKPLVTAQKSKVIKLRLKHLAEHPVPEVEVLRSALNSDSKA